MSDKYHHGDIRNALIEEGRKMINSGGEESLSMRKLAEKCGVTMAAPYAHFKNKEEMHRWQLMLHGFLLNFLNPLIWLYWVSLITILSAEVGLTSSERYIFFAGLLIAVLGMDILKCRLASMMQTWFTARRLNWFNTITGSILIIFAVYLVVSMILYQTNPDIREKEQDGTSQRSRIVQTVHQHIAKDSAKISHDTVQFR